jgi:ABC-type dipeptide/oligopeptide/nickel transport system permease component
MPGDPAYLIAGPRATAAQIALIRHELGLDRPIYVQYFAYMSNLIRLDLGTSLVTRQPVMSNLLNFFPATFELTTFSMIITILIGIPLGVMSATKKDRPFDHLSRMFSILGVAMPSFWLGLLLQLLFYGRLGILPFGGRIDGSIQLAHITGLYTIDSLLSFNLPALLSSLEHLILPALTLSFATVGTIVRFSRATMLEVLRQDYIKTAKAKGLSNRVVIYKHALRNSLISILTIGGITYAFMLGGSVMVEEIFSWPGIGRYAAESIIHLDFPAVVGVTLLMAVITVLVNLGTDLIYTYIDPRIKFGR